MKKYIEKETGITASKMLLSFIMNPQKLFTINNTALKNIVCEYAPIFQKTRYILDGSAEQQQLAVFNMYLSQRIDNKPDLKILLHL